MPLSRRLFITGLSSVIGGFCYARYVETVQLELTHREVPTKSITKKLRVLHLSDFHASPDADLQLVRGAITLGLLQRPDVICLTGDFVDRGSEVHADFGHELMRLSEAAPTFAVMGNHDGGDWLKKQGGETSSQRVRKFVATTGVEVLQNKSVTMAIGGQRLELVGVGDWWAGELLHGKAFPGGSQSHYRIVLSHNPDTKRFLGDYLWDLMLCGHTHGGQIVIPFTGHAPFAPVHDKEFVEGLKPWMGRLIHITRGLASTPALRFNCKPEVSILDLVPA